jgi:hypothetical protein
MRVGGAVEVGFDQAHGVGDPIKVECRGAAAVPICQAFK